MINRVESLSHVLLFFFGYRLKGQRFALCAIKFYDANR
jgi:hypothetical protein